MREEPFPDHPAPSAADCRAALRALAGEGPLPSVRAGAQEADCGRVPTVLEALVRTILSQNTTNANSRAAMASLVDRFGGDWARVHAAPQAEVADALRRGGLANVKAARIKGILAALQAERGELSLEHLRGAPDEGVKEALMAYPGVGHKTASCVLLFCLGRPSFAVDTHVHRIAGLLGWTPPGADRDATYHHLDRRVPNPLKYDLHVLLVRHGQRCPACRAQAVRAPRPPPPCVLSPLRAQARAQRRAHLGAGGGRRAS